MPVLRKCKNCKKVFKTKPFFVKLGQGKYCSSACHHQGMKNGKIVKCFICKKDVYKTLKALRTSKSKKYFCTKKCQTIWRNSIYIGSKHANFTTGRSSYKSVLSRNKVPKICKLCGTKDVRILAVHHIDQNRENNKLKNLMWLCHNCHHLVHRYPDERNKFELLLSN
jgi:hypothetical protein